MNLKLLLLAVVGLSSCNAQTKSKMSDPYAMAPIPAAEAGQEVAVLASGCFWGTEFYLQKVPGVIATTCGYTGGFVKNPSYREVCTKRTGHYEAVHVVFDPAQVSFEKLVRVFFETHDPTQRNGQGPDIGPQYRSAVFFQNEAQRETAKISRQRYCRRRSFTRRRTTIRIIMTTKGEHPIVMLQGSCSKENILSTKNPRAIGAGVFICRGSIIQPPTRNPP